MLAKRLPTILPDLTLAEALETTRIHSVMGTLNGQAIIATRPFRSPHHTISDAGLVGGGSVPKPGEVSLAHNGVLFLDELPEFRRNVLEVMRQPLEDGSITVSRAMGSINYPASFMLVAAMNPCVCGFLTDPPEECTCTALQIKRYCAVKDDAERLLETAINKLGLSARAYSRVLKVGRTIADLADAENIEAAHIAEAIQYRSLDRSM